MMRHNLAVTVAGSPGVRGSGQSAGRVVTRIQKKVQISAGKLVKRTQQCLLYFNSVYSFTGIISTCLPRNLPCFTLSDSLTSEGPFLTLPLVIPQRRTNEKDSLTSEGPPCISMTHLDIHKVTLGSPPTLPILRGLYLFCLNSKPSNVQPGFHILWKPGTQRNALLQVTMVKTMLNLLTRSRSSDF